MKLAPITLFVYNRPWHTQKVLDALAENEEAKDSILYIFCDGAKDDASAEVLKNIDEVADVVENENRFKRTIVKNGKSNKGLANSIIDGVSEIVNRYDKVIVLEDDIVVSKQFLSYMNWALNTYSDDESVANISGFTFNLKIDRKLVKHDSFFLCAAECWGWATWKRAWKYFEPNGQILLDAINKKKLLDEFDCNGNWNNSKMLLEQMNGKNNSWWIRWYASCLCNQLLTLYPIKSFTQNIGLDGSGTHCGIADIAVKQIESFDYSKITVKKLSINDWHKFYLGGKKINSNSNNDVSFLMKYIFKIFKGFKSRLFKNKFKFFKKFSI